MKINYSNREEVKSWFEHNDTFGWHILIDIIYDNKPDHIEISEVFEKYAGLEVRCTGEDENYDYLLKAVKTVSQSMCQICGKSASHSYIDGWETTLCDAHFESSKADYKNR